MNKTHIFLLSIATLFFIVLGLVYWQGITSSFGKDTGDLLSPVDSNQPVGLNQWFPGDILGVKTNAPEVTARSALFVETNSRKVLYSKNAAERLSIASLTKVMTAIIALENRTMEDQFIVSANASAVEPDKMGLLEGEIVSVRELLYGMFLISANDAAEVIAENSVGSRDKFIKLMNEKAVQIGMRDTHYVNPTGFDEDGENTYSTAYDQVLLTRYAIKHFPELVNISKTDHIILSPTVGHSGFEMYTGINLITTYPGVVGFKIGYTPMAGYTIITLARQDNHEVIGVLLNTQSRRDETRKLLDYSFKQL